MDDNMKVVYYNHILKGLFNVKYTERVYHNQAKHYYFVNRIMKTIQMLLTAITSSGIFQVMFDGMTIFTWISSISAFLLLFVSSITKELKLEKIGDTYIDATKHLWAIIEEYSQFMCKYDKLNDDEIEKQYNKIVEEISKVYKEVPETSDIAYNKAVKQFNKMLNNATNDNEEEEVYRVTGFKYRKVKESTTNG